MSDFPKGGDIEATRAWLDKEGFAGVFIGWKADAILGNSSQEYLKSKFADTDEGIEKAEMLFGFLNTARQNSSGNVYIVKVYVKLFV